MYILELKNSVGGFKNRLHTAEQITSELENKSDENTQKEARR